MSNRHFEFLEPRQLLTSFAFNGAWTDAAVDHNADGFNRAVDVWFNVSATGGGTGHFYVDVYEDDGAVGSDWLVRTSTQTLASGSSSDVGVSLPADLLALPGDDTDGVCEFRLSLVNADTSTVVQTWTAASDADLGNIQMQTAAQDAVGGDTPPVLGSLLATASGVPALGDTVSLSVHATEDVGPAFVLFWVDKDGNGVPNPESDLIGVGGSYFGSRTGGTATDGTWTTAVAIDSSWGTGTVSIGCIAADPDGNYATPVLTTIHVDALPVVSNVTASASVITITTPFTLTATASDSDGSVTAVTFFIDVNNDGSWTSSTDVDLGADFSSAGGWSITRNASVAWGQGTRSILASALDNDGHWSVETATSVRFNAAPTVTSASVQVAATPVSFLTYGDFATIIATPVDTGGAIARATFMLDVDNNGSWTNGVDINLGSDTDGSNGWSVSFTVPTTWAAQSNWTIICDAVDTDGAWALSRATRAIRINDRPVPGTVTAQAAAAVGETITLSATAADSNLYAVTFFYDADHNGEYDFGTDIDLGSDHNPAGGYSISVVVQADWGTTAYFASNATDLDGVWGVVPAVSGAMAISPGPRVISASTTASGTLGAGETFVVSAVVAPQSGTRAVTFFLDINDDGSFTPNVDMDIGADFDGTDGWSRTVTVDVPAVWGDRANLRIGANAVSTTGIWGTMPAVTSAATFWSGPRVTNLAVTGNPSDGILTLGRNFTLTASLGADSQTRAVTFFYDANGNSRWDSGVDTDLGADFDGSNGWSITTTARTTWGTASAARFVASAVSTQGAWSLSNTAAPPQRLNDLTTLSNFAPSSPTVNAGASVTFSLTAVDAWGVGAVTMFLDIDGNGFWTQGVDVDLGTASRTGGTATNGTWSLLKTADWGTGTWHIVADARDSDGAWSGRRVYTTLVVA